MYLIGIRQSFACHRLQLTLTWFRQFPYVGIRFFFLFHILIAARWTSRGQMAFHGHTELSQF